MPSRLKRIYGFRDLHFITCSCYRRRQLLGTRHARDVFLRIFEQVRRKYKFEVVGHVVMREHFHILIGEPEKGNHPASSRFSSRPSPDVYSNRPEGDEAINPCCGRKVFPFRTVISGKRDFTTSMFIRTRNASRSCATCTGTQ
ncbi:MAG: hypothetical protein DMG62_22855 [Acidobacteria bacterium]|nr:MAG: hypothetical protein DMG63_19305 [Acidobacteriota bacterium]PYY20616.1 MAG: hypothetical protein DMG62_22855 [Acidobacteriota bacterium]